MYVYIKKLKFLGIVIYLGFRTMLLVRRYIVVVVEWIIKLKYIFKNIIFEKWN